MIQMTILKIAGYGPWTLMLGPDREHRLQILQASIYGKVQELFSRRGCLAFSNRHDEIFAASGGLDLADHAAIQDALAGSFDVRLSMSVGSGATPFEANLDAHAARQEGRMLDAGRDISGSGAGGASSVSIIHLDVEDLTSRGRESSPYEITSVVFGLYARMSKFFLGRGSLAFFLGGDNFMVVSGSGAKGDAEAFVESMGDGIRINCGVGTASTSRQAASLATQSLDAIRKLRDSGRERPAVYEMSC